MGSNMQRQAVPLLKTEAPIVGTGLEGRCAEDSRIMVHSHHAGVVTFVDSCKIVIKRQSTREKDQFINIPEEDVYYLEKFQRTNQDTCVNQRPLVRVGDKISIGQIIGDGPATSQRELALGKNITVAFMPWNGYNYEDAIICSEELLWKDAFTSVHIEEFELEVRDTKRGPEEITREIPNISEEALKNLDENGIVRVGAEVEAGDILVGKITPKGETELSPEERLLRAIFGDKAGDVRDSSLKLPPGMKGIILNTKIFSRKERDSKTRKQDRKEIDRLEEDIGSQVSKIVIIRNQLLFVELENEEAYELRSLETGEIYLKDGGKLNKSNFNKVNFSDVIYDEGLCRNAKVNKKAIDILLAANEHINKLRDRLEKEIDKIVRGDELQPGVIQLVKVYIAKKRPLSVGDKMAGRHGNKGIVSKLVPVENMPYMANGEPIHMILNPLGVPSRMNVGQLLETHLGWAAKHLKITIATPVFDGATEMDVKDLMEQAKVTDKQTLFDGLTGQPFQNPVTVGTIYMLKLSHLVDDKIHARSIGPYSLVTQQPLGGKSQFGGQRFGEMEVWALEAYGAAYTLQEILTVKSDDVSGRSRIYEAIVKGENTNQPGIPESFNVMVREIRSLCMDMRVEGIE
jgi:DNA-directed RNA polymerase subunit beta